MRLANVALWTQGLEAAATFWRDDFDAEVGDRYDSLNRPGFASRFARLPDENVRLELMEGPWVSPQTGEVCGWAHIALSVSAASHVDSIAERFRLDDLLVSAPRRTGNGYYEALVSTPDGTLIEIVE